MRILTFILLFLPLITFGQGMIVNEISNGASGNREYIELIVIGSQTNPLGNVDLGGWIIDDNNGDFEGSVSGVGIAQGHIRISPGCLSSVRPGSIILIYNSAELSLGSDPFDSNLDCVYIFSISDLCLENTSNLPITTNPLYTPVNYTSTRIWDRIGFRNDGDAVQVRKPDGTFFHGFSYGDVSIPYPNFPLELGGGSSFNVRTGSGTGYTYYFNCGNFTSETSFRRGTVSLGDETPGSPNNELNTYFINSVRTGNYDYSNLSNVNNCGTSLTLLPCDFILDVELLYFVSENIESSINLKWKLANVEGISGIILQRSFNAVDFEDIFESIITEQNSYEDFNYSNNNYYRLKFIETNGLESYSNMIYEGKDLKSEVFIYPNPNFGRFSIRSESKIYSVKIYDCYGRHILDINENFNDIILDLPKGLYYIQIENNFYKIQILK